MTYINTSAAQEITNSYTTYAVATANRAIPSVIDGLKVSHRRILQVCLQNNYTSWVKTARIAGETMGKLHPHGDSSTTIQGLADISSYLNPLLELHGNCGGYSLASRQKISNDSAASGRYTESRLSQFGKAVFDILDLDLLATRDSYDGSTKEIAEFVPALPLALINAQSGIGTGYATNTIGFPVKQIMKAIKDGRRESLGCPDLPYKTNIIKNQSLIDLLAEGKSSIECRGSWKVINNYKYGKKTRQALEITELASGNAEQFMEQIKELVDSGKLTGIASIEDQTSTDIKIIIICKKDIKAESLLSSLLRFTNLETKYSAKFTLMAPQSRLPVDLTPMEILNIWKTARLALLNKKYTKELKLNKLALEKATGILKLFTYLKDIALLIMESESEQLALQAIIKKYDVSQIVAASILEIKLKKLVKLSRVELENEVAQLQAEHDRLTLLTTNDEELLNNLIEIAEEVAKLACPRVSQVISVKEEIKEAKQAKQVSLPTDGVSTRKFNKEAKKYFDKKNPEWSYISSTSELRQAIAEGRGSLEDILVEEAVVKSTYVTKRGAVKSLTPGLIRRAMRNGKLASQAVKEFLKAR